MSLSPIIPGSKAWKTVDAMLDLSDRNGRDLVTTIRSLNGDEREEFIRIASTLLQAGIVGREKVRVRGLVRETFVETGMAAHERRDRPHGGILRNGRLDIYA